MAKDSHFSFSFSFYTVASILYTSVPFSLLLVYYTYAVCTIYYLDVVSVRYLLCLPGLSHRSLTIALQRVPSSFLSSTLPFFLTFLFILLWRVCVRSMECFLCSVSLPAYLHASVYKVCFGLFVRTIGRIRISRNHSTFIRIVKLINQIYR